MAKVLLGIVAIHLAVASYALPTNSVSWLIVRCILGGLSGLFVCLMWRAHQGED